MTCLSGQVRIALTIRSHRAPNPRPLWSHAVHGLRLLVLFGLGWAAGGEAQTTSRLASLTYDRNLLQERARFGALELAVPSACAAWPDSLRRTLETQVNQTRPHGFRYEVEHACGFADGDAVLSSIVNREPPFNFAYLEGYEPVARGSEDSLRVRSLSSEAVALQEYSFNRSGFAVRQVFVETPGTVYQLDMLIRDAWTDSVARVYESVLSSIHIIR